MGLHHVILEKLLEFLLIILGFFRATRYQSAIFFTENDYRWLGEARDRI